MPRPGYLEAAQELARKHGALLIFDEVITGFRIAPGGAQGHFGVIPDLATFGKAIGGGVPLSAVAGRKEIMEQMFTGGVVFGGTFNGNPLSLTGADACLTELARDNGAALIHANCTGEKIRAGLRELARKHRIPLQVTGFGAAFFLHFNSNEDILDYRDTLTDDFAAAESISVQGSGGRCNPGSGWTHVRFGGSYGARCGGDTREFRTRFRDALINTVLHAGWANLAGGRVAAHDVWPIADRYVPIRMLMDRHRAASQGTAKPAFLQLPVALGDRDSIVLGHRALGLHRADPVQVRACGAPECGSFLCRRHRELLVEDRYILLAEKLVGALDSCDSGQPQLLR